MTTSIVHTPEQEAAIRFYRRQYNAKHGTSFTNNSFADFKVKDMFDRMVETMNQERSSDELMAAFKAATPEQKTAARTALGIQEP